MNRRAADSVEAVFREEYDRLLAALAARLGDLDLAEEVAQDALEAALARWPVDGVPPAPLAWLLTVARRKAVDRIRRDQTYARRLAVLAVETDRIASAPPVEPGVVPDERLTLFFTCCHPALRLEERVALTLRFLAGMTTAEVAAAFLVPVPTMQQRIVRAKRKIIHARIPFRVPDRSELPRRLAAVLTVIYLVFSEGYAATAGATLVRSALTEESIRLTRIVHQLLPDQREVTGLLALMLLTDARRPARTDSDGLPVSLEDQDRGRWDVELLDEGQLLLSEALAGAHLVPTPSRPPSPPCTTKRRASRTPTGDRSSRCTTSCSPSPHRHWSSSTAPWPSPCATDLPPVSIWSTGSPTLPSSGISISCPLLAPTC